MSDMKTQPTDASVEGYIQCVENVGRREDAFILLELMNSATGAKPVMWGESIVGYGNYEYARADGSKHQFMLTGFSPRKANMTVYIMPGFKPYEEQLALLGKCKNSSSCLYLPRLKNIDLSVLSDIVADSILRMKERYPNSSI
ncbi:MAG: DUF1801 domain-containing protein [Pseudomonadota bacterium]